MRIYSNDFFEIRFSFFVYLALLVVLLPLQLVFAWLIAVLVHELCHYIPLRIFRVSVTHMTLGCGGMVMSAGAMLPWQELISALAGPVGGLILLLGRKWIPMTASCALIQSVFNLLPFYPLDGGRAARLLVDMMHLSREYRRVLFNIKRGVALLFLLSVFYVFRHTVLFIYCFIFLVMKTFFFLLANKVN